MKSVGEIGRTQEEEEKKGKGRRRETTTVEKEEEITAKHTNALNVSKQ